MPMRSMFAALMLVVVCGSLAVGLRQEGPKEPRQLAVRKARVLPGVQADGAVMLPNQWSLRPAGKQIALGDFPVNIALHPQCTAKSGYLAVLHAGYGPHEVVVMDITPGKEKVVSRVQLDQTFHGLAFSPDGSKLYVSGGEFEVVHAFDFTDGLLGSRKLLRVATTKEKYVVSGLTVSGDGKTLFTTGTWGHEARLLDLANPAKVRKVSTGADSYPYACLPSIDGKSLYVTLWGASAVAVIDLAQDKVMATWKTDSHPTEMALSPDGKTLYVSCSNSTRVNLLNTTDGQSAETLQCSLYPKSPSGNTPSSLSLTPDGQILFVANSDANNLAVFNVAKPGASKSLGFIPVGWYPTAVRYNPADKRVYVANGKGISSSANSQGPGPNIRRELSPLYQYIGGLMKGTLSVLPTPTPEDMLLYTKSAYEASPLRKDFTPLADGWTEGNPVPNKVGEKSPIKHVIYIIKENRTYDQVFGDLPQGNGDPGLCLFPEEITPNHHRLATQFVLLDNLYVEGEVSADGHEWSMGAYATDFVEKVWPLNYRGSPLKKLSAYPSEGTFDKISRPAGGYIWDRAKAAGVSYRSYGEWVNNGKMNPDGTFEDGKAAVKALEGHIDPKFRSYDLDYLDQKRADRFISELKRFEKEGGMPQLTILRLPNDHTYGTRVGKPTPRAMVADNDLALGRVVEAVSKSKFWKETALFVIEDDAQNGPDHVDAHRAVALVVSPYTKRKFVDSNMYSTSSMLRTMELILGLEPMSQFDAAARPMYNSFQVKPDMTPYVSVKPRVKFDEKNTADVWGADASAKFDFSKEDLADDILFNEVIWRSIKGAKSPMPAPVRAGFFIPKVKGVP